MNAETKPFYRDSSDRLCFDLYSIDSFDYPAVSQKIVARFSLQPASELLIGLDEMFRDYSRGELRIQLAWDNWCGFFVTALHTEAETLVREIAEFVGVE